MEILDGVEVRRYRYAPRRLETLVYGGGMLQQLRTNPWKWLMVLPFALAQILATVRALRSLRPALMHSHWCIPQGLLACIARFVAHVSPPLIITSHGSDIFGLKGKLFVRIRRWLGAKAAVWTVVSPRLAQQLVVEGVAGALHDIPVLPMGTDLETRFCPGEEVRDPHQILYVGRLVPGKGLDVLLQAMPHVLRRFPSASLLVVGDGPLANSLVVLAKTLGLGERVRLVGALPNAELPSVFRRAAVHAAPFTKQQGFGLTLVESLGCGCPIVTTPLAAGVDMAGAGSMIQLIEADDSFALAEALMACLQAPPSTLEVREAIRHVRENYDWSSVAEGFRTIYFCALSRGAR